MAEDGLWSSCNWLWADVRVSIVQLSVAAALKCAAWWSESAIWTPGDRPSEIHKIAITTSGFSENFYFENLYILYIVMEKHLVKSDSIFTTKLFTIY